jgi:NADPH:quinone reductase
MSLPRLMKAAAVDRFGPPSAIRIHELPVPQPAHDEILIRVETAGIGYWDRAIRDGSWRRPGRTRFPLVLGTDGAGVVAAKGSRVKRFQVGDRVYAYEFGNPKGGFYAEYAVAKARHAAQVPATLSLLQAGVAVPAALTALQGITGVLRLKRRQTILVFGASGGVGTLAVQFAKHCGARVLATASGPRAARLVRRLGADAVIDARRDDAADLIRKLAPAGIDAALALAGGDALERCLDFMRPGGRVAFPNGIEPAPPRGRRSIRRASYDLSVTPRWFERLRRRISTTPVRVPIDTVFPLAGAAAAHRRLAKGSVLGRMALRVRG